MKKDEEKDSSNKKQQRKSANSEIFKACSDIVYCFLKSPNLKFGAKDIQNQMLQNRKMNRTSTDTEISSNVYRKALLYLSNDVFFLENASYGKYELSDSITTFNADEILSKLKIDKDKLSDAVKIINGDNDLKLVIPKNDTDLSLKSQKLCSLFRGNDTSLISDIFQSAFTDFSISNFKGLIRDTLLSAKLYKCFNSNDYQLMPVLLQIIKYKLKVDMNIQQKGSSLKFESVKIIKVEIANEYFYIISDTVRIKLNSINEIQLIRIISKNINSTKMGLPLINQKILEENLINHEKYSSIKKDFNIFKEIYEFDKPSTFDESFTQLIKLNLIKDADTLKSKHNMTLVHQVRGYIRASDTNSNEIDF